jgi:hypothetical protein
MDKINTFITQYSQRNLEKKILFPYKQSCQIANDIYRKKKSRYETIVDNCEVSSKKNMHVIESIIKKKYLLGTYSLMKKDKVIPKIINLLYNDQIHGISNYLYKDNVNHTISVDNDSQTYYLDNSTTELLDSTQKTFENNTNSDLEVKNESETSSDYNDLEYEKSSELIQQKSVDNCFLELKVDETSNDNFESFDYLGLEIIKMKQEHFNKKSIGNEFLFSIMYSVDTLYCNWVSFDTQFKNENFFFEAQKNTVFFEKYLHAEILKKFYSSKIKQRRMIESLHNIEYFENICELVSQLFHINLIILTKSMKENTYEYTPFLFPTDMTFNKKKKTIFVVDWCPTYVCSSTLLNDNFWKIFFRKEITNKSKLADIRKYCKIFDISEAVDIKNKKLIIDQVIFPKLDLLFNSSE